MANNKRLFLSLSEEDVTRLDMLRSDLGMNRSQYIRYVISGRDMVLTPSIKYKDLIERFSEIELDLKVIALKNTMGLEDKLSTEIAIKEIKALLSKKGTSGQLD